jgi:hypothetical protein
VQGKGAQPQERGEFFRAALPVAQRPGDVEVRGVRRDRLDARGDVLGDGQELRVQVRVAGVGEVEVGVEDVALVHSAHPGLPGLV